MTSLSFPTKSARTRALCTAEVLHVFHMTVCRTKIFDAQFFSQNPKLIVKKQEIIKKDFTTEFLVPKLAYSIFNKAVKICA